MLPFTAQDLVRLVAEEAQSARPFAPVRAESAPAVGTARLDRARLGFGLVLRRLADWVEPARSTRPASAMRG